MKEQSKLRAAGLRNSQWRHQKHRQQTKGEQTGSHQNVKTFLLIETQATQYSSNPQNRRTHVNHVSDNDECLFRNLGFNGSNPCQVPKANVLPQGYEASLLPWASTWTEINHFLR